MSDEPTSTPETNPAPVDTPPPPTPEPPSRPLPEASRNDESVFQRLENALTGLPEAVANAVREQTPQTTPTPTPAETAPTNSVSTVKGPGRLAKWWYGK